MGVTSSSVGFCPIDLITGRSSLVEMVPLLSCPSSHLLLTVISRPSNCLLIKLASNLIKFLKCLFEFHRLELRHGHFHFHPMGGDCLLFNLKT